INVKDSEISSLNTSLEMKDAELADFQASLNAKDVELEGLNASITAKDAEVEGLRGRLLGNIKSPGWFDWGEYDFFNWNEGDDVEFVGTGDAGGTIDVTYGADTIGTADVDDNGNWNLGWLVPGAFLPGMLGFIRRDRDGVEVDATRGNMSASIDAALPDVDIDADIPEVDVDVDADGGRGWFSWPDWDFSGWRAGETRELSGVGEPGGTVDVMYNGEVVETVDVDDDGKWSWEWLLPAGFAAGGLGFLGRNRDGAEVEASAGADFDLDVPEVEASVEVSPDLVADYEADIPDMDVNVDVDADADASVRGRWFSWPDWDFTGWREGETRELSGMGEPGGTVDVMYNGEVVETVDVDEDGKWNWEWLLPAGFAAGGLGFLGRDRDGVEIEAPAVDVDAEVPLVNLDAELPGMTVDVDAPEVDVDVDADGRSRWFNWPEWDFSAWGEGETRELSGVGEPGGTVDVMYDGQVVGTAPVDDDGKWNWSWLIPAGFSAGGLGFLARDKAGAEIDIDVNADTSGHTPMIGDGPGMAYVDPNLPSADVEVDVEAPELDIEAESRWKWGGFNWPDWDFSGWGEGDEVELNGTGAPSGSVDVNYNGDVVGTAPVDDGGNWRWGWTVPAGFAASGLGFLSRDKDGKELESSTGAGYAATLTAAGALAVGLGGAFVDLISDTRQTTIRLEDIEGDDLTKIWGIGPKTKLNFYRRGITTFEQFANIDPDTLSEIMAESRLMSARIPKNPHADWTGLAALAAKGDWDAFNEMTTKIKPPEPERKKKRKASVKLDGDKLTEISGIGRGTWKALHAKGYNSYAKLANISVEEVEEVMRKSRALNAPGAPTPAEAHASWTELAGLAAAGDWNAFNARNAGLDGGTITRTVSEPTRFDAMGYDFSGWEAGQERSFFGRENPGSVIRFYYDGNEVGQTTVADDGSWEFPFTVPEGFTPALMTFTMS
ncbi:MAG: helix-hairpin-helix domain-containing protein, partial [Chloroflexota bacterium]